MSIPHWPSNILRNVNRLPLAVIGGLKNNFRWRLDNCWPVCPRCVPYYSPITITSTSKYDGVTGTGTPYCPTNLLSESMFMHSCDCFVFRGPPCFACYGSKEGVARNKNHQYGQVGYNDYFPRYRAHYIWPMFFHPGNYGFDLPMHI